MESVKVFERVFALSRDRDFPFRDMSWRAVAFERNSYDNARLPQWFFEAASGVFSPSGEGDLLIAGDCFDSAGLPRVCRVPFNWTAFRAKMLEPAFYSVEYQIANSDLTCGCLADAEITIFGGEPVRMAQVFERLGGEERLLQIMRQEFLLGDTGAYEEMDRFLQGLIDPKKRTS
jgi:hypothetical protein